MPAPQPPPVTPETTARAIARLQEGIAAGPAFKLNNPRTLAALDYLERALPGAWAVEQFRSGLRLKNDTARFQNCAASLNGIKLAVGGFPANQEE